MNRWSAAAVLLLLLLPLTMAPRIALVPAESPLVVQAKVPKGDVREGQPVHIVFYVQNNTGGAVDSATLTVKADLNGSTKELLVRPSSECAAGSVTEGVYHCDLGSMKDGKTAPVQFMFRPLTAGTLTLESAASAFSGVGTTPRVPADLLQVNVTRAAR